MGTDSKIAWTHHTFNPWIGCEKIAPECANCYAAEYAERYGIDVWGKHKPRRLTAPANWRKPLKWNREAEAAGERRRVFCASLGDLFEDFAGPIVNAKGARLYDVGDGYWRPESEINRRAFPGFSPDDAEFAVTMNDVRGRLFELPDQTPWLDWLFLTKRPENVLPNWPHWVTVCSTEKTDIGERRPKRFENVWLGTTAGTQKGADKRIPELLKLRDLSPVLFVSAEPLLEPVDLGKLICGWCPKCGYDLGTWDRCSKCGHKRKECPPLRQHRDGESYVAAIDWIIGGLESGDQRRDPGVEPLLDLARQCLLADIPFFCKQDCARTPGQRGRIPAPVWNLKQFPVLKVATV